MLNNTERYYHGLDMLRAGLMLILVFFHAAASVSPFNEYNPYKSYGIYYLTYIEYLFCMETFFLISGFLSQMVLQKKGKKYLLHSRWLRVAVPLLLGSLGLNILTTFVHVQVNKWYPCTDISFFNAIQNGWFLVTLFIFVLIDFILPKNIFSCCRGKTVAWAIVGVLFIYFITIYFKEDLIARFGYHFFNFIFFHTLKFYSFYLFGSWLFNHQEILQQIRWKTILFITIGAIIFASLRYFHDLKLYSIFEPFYQKSYLWGELLYQANFILSGLCLSFLFFYFFYQIKKENSAMICYLMASAIVIYLAHPLFISIFTQQLNIYFPTTFNNKTYYLLLVSLTFIFSFAFYEIVKRFHPLRVAFGLKT